MNKGNYALALAIIIGTLGGTMILGQSFINMKQLGRSIEVRGLAERQVKADSALWVIPFNATNESLVAAQAKIESDSAKIIEFLKKYNISDVEISQRSIRVLDRLAQLYTQEKSSSLRYFITAELVVKSNNIEAVVKASQAVNELINQNITIAYEEYGVKGPRFFFTKLNEIKPEMIAESIKQARRAAEEFEINSGSKIGKIKNASQGVFSIFSKEAASSGDQNSYGSDEASFIDKAVRVITKVEYYLED